MRLCALQSASTRDPFSAMFAGAEFILAGGGRGRIDRPHLTHPRVQENQRRDISLLASHLL